MTLDDFKNLKWCHPWHPEESQGSSQQLALEVGPGHVLYGRKAIAVAFSLAQDDVLFFLPDGPTPLAVVHLTYSPVAPSSPRYTPGLPATALYSSLQDWIDRCMIPDHRGEVPPYDQ
jgi:hypothetical protein